MYLTRITLNKSQVAKLKIRDAYAWHQKLWEAFPGRDGEKRNFLFRIDDAGRDICVLMLSHSEPDKPAWGYWELKPIADSFLQHNTYRFQLKANPTMRRASDKRRLGIYQEDRLYEWIQRKADQNGFDVRTKDVTISAPVEEYFVKNSRRGKHVAVDFQGVLSVNDRTAFIKAFENGIGSAKAFGFGMLMLDPKD